jgi:DNA-directed RNA polymerase specialized sigma24 family protein
LADVPLEKQDMASETWLALDPRDSDLNPEETCLQLERKRIVVAAINKLTPTLRMAMKLRELHDLSTQETAGIHLPHLPEEHRFDEDRTGGSRGG